MRKIGSILCLLLMLLQAIPVLHFFYANKAAFYAYVDEEKPEQKSKVGKEDYHQELTTIPPDFMEVADIRTFSLFIESQHASPLLEFLTPPPDAC